MHECLLWENGINSNKIYQERHEQICVMKKANRLYIYKGYNEIKEGHPIKFEYNWIKELKQICIKFKSNLDY